VAPRLSRNPLGIIALFIVMIYGFASLVLGIAAKALTQHERWPLIAFLVSFPVVVLWTFYILVSKHHHKLYAPFEYPTEVVPKLFIVPSIPVPTSNEPITQTHIALTSTCWRAPKHDSRFPYPVYRFDVVVVGADSVLDRIERVVYHLPPAWNEFGTEPRAFQEKQKRLDRFRLEDITFSDLIVHADVYVREQKEPVTLSTFVQRSETGHRL
jgi:hypothetical protein